LFLLDIFEVCTITTAKSLFLLDNFSSKVKSLFLLSFLTFCCSGSDFSMFSIG
jgi:hypothetical protein